MMETFMVVLLSRLLWILSYCKRRGNDGTRHYSLEHRAPTGREPIFRDLTQGRATLALGYFHFAPPGRRT
jgi:hypothetical protein